MAPRKYTVCCTRNYLLYIMKEKWDVNEGMLGDFQNKENNTLLNTLYHTTT